MSSGSWPDRATFHSHITTGASVTQDLDPLPLEVRAVAARTMSA
jgi:hypothetical protein